MQMFLQSSDNNNHGGFSMHDKGVNKSSSDVVKIRAADAFLSEIGVSSVDLIKIDTEGHEWPILKSIEDIALGAEWIVGELHGIDDYKVLDMLSNKFLIKQNKEIGKDLSLFYACKANGISLVDPKDLRTLDSKR
jgi:hypothetical protein